MVIKKTTMWVATDFKRKLKKEAADANIPMIDFTKRIADDLEPVKRCLDKKEKRFRHGLPKF